MFEASALVKPLVFIIGFQAALYVLVLRPWRVRELGRALSPSLDLFAASLVAIACVALLEPRPMEDAARWLVAQTTLPDSIATIDAQLAEVEHLPDRLWADIKATFGFEAPPPHVPPSSLERPGTVEAAVVGAVEEIVAIVMRVYVYLTCVVSLWIAIIVRLVARSLTARQLRDERLIEATADAVESQLRARL